MKKGNEREQNISEVDAGYVRKLSPNQRKWYEKMRDQLPTRTSAFSSSALAPKKSSGQVRAVLETGGLGLESDIL